MTTKEKQGFGLYFLLAFGLAWLCQVGGCMALLQKQNAVLYQLALVATMLCPLLAVLLVQKVFLRQPTGIGWKVQGKRRYWLAAFALLFVSSLILSIFWTGNMIVIYLLHALVYCLYMVWQLYHSEFFTFSLVTASAGVVFYLIARTSYMANRIAGSALLALILIGTALTAFLCAKNHGKLNLGSRMLRLFPDGFNPLLFYFICVLWAVVLAACLIFGSGFAFYAMFAAIAVELIGAVYYTFQLK